MSQADFASYFSSKQNEMGEGREEEKVREGERDECDAPVSDAAGAKVRGAEKAKFNLHLHPSNCPWIIVIFISFAIPFTRRERESERERERESWAYTCRTISSVKRDAKTLLLSFPNCAPLLMDH